MKVLMILTSHDKLGDTGKGKARCRSRFVGAERFRRRLAKVAELESCRKGVTA